VHDNNTLHWDHTPIARYLRDAAGGFAGGPLDFADEISIAPADAAQLQKKLAEL
jgi:hypothetical protein